MNKDSVIFLATKQNPRVLEFLFEELPSKGDDATVSQGCLCILDPKVYFLSDGIFYALYIDICDSYDGYYFTTYQFNFNINLNI